MNTSGTQGKERGEQKKGGEEKRGESLVSKLRLVNLMFKGCSLP